MIRTITLLGVLAVSAGALAAPSGARTYRAHGGFRIVAPAGWKLRARGGGHVLTCGSRRAAFGRFTTRTTPRTAGRALAAEAGLSRLSEHSTSTRYRATLGATVSGAVRRGGVSVRRRGRLLSVAFWSGSPGKGCGLAATSARARRAHAAATLDAELSHIAGTAAGGLVSGVSIKGIETLDNPAIPLHRFEVCSNSVTYGQPPCTSALLPEAWIPNLSLAPGTVQGIGAPGNPYRGELVLGGVAPVYQATCLVPYRPGETAAPYTGDPAKAVTDVLPQQWAVAAAQPGGAGLYTPISKVRVVQTLRSPWIDVGGPPNALYLARWTEDGKPWTAVIGSAVQNTAPDACYWTWYFTMIATPDGGAAGVPTALVEAWASWRNSYAPVTNGLVAPPGRSAFAARSAAAGPVARAAAAQPGSTAPTAEQRRGRLGRFGPHRSRHRRPDFRRIVAG